MAARVSASTQPDPEAPPPVDADTEHETGEVILSQWEFIDRVPTAEDVIALLAGLPDVWGIAALDYLDFVQPLPQSKKVKRTNERGQVITDSVDCYVLYMSVAGRQKMINDAAEKHGWRVDFVPEPVTPTGAAGYISLEPRIVYREYVQIRLWTEGEVDPVLGSKPGTAWVPFSGGSNAAASNPYEKVETSARGRAIAAWGFGVFPGSGVASLEEMQGARANALGMEMEKAAQGGWDAPRGQRPARGTRRPQVNRDDRLTAMFEVSEELRQARGLDDKEHHARLVHFLTTNLGIRGAVSADGVVDWDKIKDGQIELLTNSLRTSLRNFRDEGSQV